MITDLALINFSPNISASAIPSIKATVDQTEKKSAQITGQNNNIILMLHGKCPNTKTTVE